MIQEQAVYHCFIANGEDRFDPESMEIKEDDTGPVYLCTFPGLARTIKKDNESGKTVVWSVKASVVLKSVLPVKGHE